MSNFRNQSYNEGIPFWFDQGDLFAEVERHTYFQFPVTYIA